MQKIKNIAILSIFALLSSCTNIETCLYGEGIDPYLIGSETCQPPCWNDITPGKTTLSEAKMIFWQMKMDGLGILHDTSNGDYTWENTKTSPCHQNVYLSTDDNGIVEEISFYLVTEPTLKELIDLLGEPAGMKFGEMDESEWYIYLYYPERALIFLAGGSGAIKISSRTYVGHATFLPKVDIQEFFDRYLWEDQYHQYQEWRGYGPVFP
ncbi:MAG: hypothetical protein PVF83_13360 [Anaerolineales bacterium]|jgi:hypothetical protein